MEIKKQKLSSLRRFLPALFWLLVWQIVSMVVGKSLFFVSPGRVVVTLVRLAGQGRFWQSVLRTTGYLFMGTLGGTAAGVLLASLAAKWTLAEALFSPLIHLVKSVPVVSYIVLALICLSSRGLSRLLSFLVVLPMIYVNVLGAAKRMDPGLSEMARIYRMRRGDRIRYLVLPQVFPGFLSAFSVAVGTAWKAGIAAEVIGMPPGTIGERIQQAKIYLETAELFAWTLVVIVLSFLMEKLLRFLMGKVYERSQRTRYQRWYRRRKKEPAIGEKACPDCSPSVRVQGLRKSFDGVPVLSDFSACFEGGEVTALMAPSGWGKTTLLRLIAGLEVPDAGEISFPAGPERRKARAAGENLSLRMMFQENRLIGHLDPVSNIGLANPACPVKKILHLLEEAGLANDLEKTVEEYSGGMQRRVSLLRALASDADVLLLDEPFTGLDAARKEAVMELSYRVLAGKTVIMAVHERPEKGKVLSVQETGS